MAYFAAGVRFDARPLLTFFQFADKALLQDRLLETTWHLHMQPPAFNFLAGLVLKLAGEHYPAAFHLLFLLLGLCLTVCLYRLMRRFEVPDRLAAVLTGVFMASPGVVLFENFLIYDYPILVGLTAAALALFGVLDNPAFTRFALFFGLLTVLVWTRSLFHLAWYAAVSLIAIFGVRRERRRVLSAALAGSAVCGLLYVKNWVLVGVFTTSTWLGFNLYSVGVHNLDAGEKERLIESGVLSPIARIPSASPLSAYSGHYPPAAHRGVPVLDQETRSSGRPNFNNPAYVEIQRQYARDFFALVRHRPGVYLRAVVTGIFTYFLPTSDFPFFTQNRGNIAALDRPLNVAAFGQFLDASDRKALRRTADSGSPLRLVLFTGTFLLAGLPLLWFYGLREVRHGRRPKPQRCVLLFMLLSIGCVTVVVNILSPFENNRYRLDIDGFHVVLLGAAATSFFRRPAGARHASPPGCESPYSRPLPASPAGNPESAASST